MSREKKANEKEKKKARFVFLQTCASLHTCMRMLKEVTARLFFCRCWLKIEFCHHSMNDVYGVAYEAEDLNIFFYVILTSTHCYLSHNQPGF